MTSCEMGGMTLRDRIETADAELPRQESSPSGRHEHRCHEPSFTCVPVEQIDLDREPRRLSEPSR